MLFRSFGDKPVLILGDLNMPSINWDDPPYLPDEVRDDRARIENAWLTYLTETNSKQLITEPTHVAGNILDVVITNDEEHTYDIPAVVRAPTMADHYVTVVDYLIEGPTRAPPKRARWELNTNKRNWEVWNATMEHLNISESMDNAASLNDATELLNNAIRSEEHTF